MRGILMTCMFIHEFILSSAYALDAQQNGNDTFTAAVYEHLFVLPFLPRGDSVTREAAVAYMMTNMDVYEENIAIAKDQGASLIVFPEYGLTGVGFPTREAFAPYLEDIPDPQEVNFNPSSDLSFNVTVPVLYRLSSLARHYQIYVVANMGDKKNCEQSDGDCPSNGQYQYNTNVVFDPDGTLVARYHKEHLFLGELRTVDKTTSPQHITFNTPFGKFGTFICFDVLFKEPALTLVESHQIDHVVFPTAWFDQLPLFAGIGFHGSWARYMGVNYLGANTHIPERNSTGSGLYTPDGAVAYYRNRTTPSSGKLLISELSKNPQRSFIVDEASGTINNIEYSPNQNEFYSYLFGDLFLFRSLETSNEYFSLCYNNTNVCCSLSYNISNPQRDEHYALGVFNGLHTLEGQYYLEICVLLKCAGLEQESCGTKTESANTVFDSFELRAQTVTTYVYPQVIVDGVNLIPGEWKYEHKMISVNQTLSSGLITAALFGRNYDLDPPTAYPTSPPPSPTSGAPQNFYKYIIYLILLSTYPLM